MALDTPFLAAETPAVRRSRALHRFTVASPLVLLLAVGTVGHVRRAPLVPSAGLAEYDRRVLAYAPRVRAVRAIAPQTGLPKLAEARREAERWVAGYRSGELAPLRPAYFEDHLQNGPRGEVVRSGVALSSVLSLLAAREIERGRAGEGARTAILSAQVAQGLRDFEIQALLQSLLAQRRATYVLGQAWEGLPARERADAAPALRSLFVDPADPERLEALDRRQFEAYRRRQKLGDAEASTFSRTVLKNERRALERSVRISNAQVDRLLKTVSKDAPL